MQYVWKLYKWNGGNLADRTELTQYLVMPVFLERRLNERMPSGEVILEGVPTDILPLPYMPKTKITIEKWVSGQLDRYYDYVVEHDDVEQYAGCPEICCHRIHLIDPSVITQGMHCDNFSLTYELNDVTLEYKTVVPEGTKATKLLKEIENDGNFTRPPMPPWKEGTRGLTVGPGGNGWWNELGDYTVYYENSYFYLWKETASLDNILLNQNGLEEQKIEFSIPLLKCYANAGPDGIIELFDCPVRCLVSRTTYKDGSIQPNTKKIIVNKLYSPKNVQSRNDRYMYNTSGKAGIRNLSDYHYREGVGDSSTARYTKVFGERLLSNFPAMINTNLTDFFDRKVSFSTDVLSPEDVVKKLSYKYDVLIRIEPYENGALVKGYKKKCVIDYQGISFWEQLIFRVPHEEGWYTTESTTTLNPSKCQISLSFNATDLTESIPTPFLLKGRPYNCYDLLRKAMLTCDTRILDNTVTGLDEQTDGNGIKYPIEPDDEWKSKLKQTTMYESVFEQKNLWEVMQQIGYYLHAVPYLEFARDGEDKFILRFRQLGKGYDYDETGNKIEKPESNKITVFNSNALEEFYTQYDSYVTNIFSPQNEIEEFLVVKTSDPTRLVSNNTAELHTKYNISELVEFDITYKGQTQPALDYVFEESIYKTLTSKTNFTPGKWAALYYKLGTNKILGLNYVPHTANNDGYMALKTIVAKVFTNGTPESNLHFNDLQFRVKYRTQDSLRITQLRPDLTRFMKNSVFDHYPHHEQFYGQQDKIVDSERFSANLWGRLVRVANGVYQCQEYATYGQEKEPGDIVSISDEAYYVTETENEYYGDAIFQKVTYSKDFNNLSNIVTIPSEPRFYEVSERSMVRREIRFLEFLKLKTTSSDNAPQYLNETTGADFLAKLFFAEGGNPKIPNYAYTNFKADSKRSHYGLENNESTLLFPSSATQIEGGAVQPLPNSANKAVVVPALHFPLRNSLIIEWDMEDNFSAGDFVDSETAGELPYAGNNTVNNIITSLNSLLSNENQLTGLPDNSADAAYFALQAVRYCDLYGRADLMEFRLFHKETISNMEDKRLLPLPSIEPTAEESQILSPIGKSIALDKDNREALSFNYQLCLLYDTEFVTFPNLFGTKKEKLRVMLLNRMVSKLSETLEFSQLDIVADNISYGIEKAGAGLKITFTFDESEIIKAKAILFYDLDNGGKIPYIARNIEGLSLKEKQSSWYIQPTYSE